ncbi:Probable E3 ubiquitin-protein ligase sinah [Gryllus bimaculatus]|nr:Probable E3 ubiquitin-protein ligase sinah [Gryllus bimaculatus]
MVGLESGKNVEKGGPEITRLVADDRDIQQHEGTNLMLAEGTGKSGERWESNSVRIRDGSKGYLSLTFAEHEGEFFGKGSRGSNGDHAQAKFNPLEASIVASESEDYRCFFLSLPPVLSSHRRGAGEPPACASGVEAALAASFLERGRAHHGPVVQLRGAGESGLPQLQAPQEQELARAVRRAAARRQHQPEGERWGWGWREEEQEKSSRRPSSAAPAADGLALPRGAKDAVRVPQEKGEEGGNGERGRVEGNNHKIGCLDLDKQKEVVVVVKANTEEEGINYSHMEYLRNKRSITTKEYRARKEYLFSPNMSVINVVMDTACINDRLITVIACPMCLKSMRSTILQCENGHNVCFDCRQSLPACPFCNEYFSGLRNLLAEQIISNLFLEYCENGIRGCRALVPADRVQLHRATCPYRLMFCWICRNDVAFNKIMIHFHRKHPDNVIKNGMSRVGARIRQGRGRKGLALSLARLIGYCFGIRLVLIGEITINYRPEQPAARILLQTASEFTLVDKLLSKILPQPGPEPYNLPIRATFQASLDNIYTND